MPHEPGHGADRPRRHANGIVGSLLEAGLGEKLGDVNRTLTGSVVYLVPARCARCDDNGVRICRPHRREQNQFADLHRHVIVLALVPKRTGHTATTGGNLLHRAARQRAEHFASAGSACDCLLVTVPVQQDFPIDTREDPLRVEGTGTAARYHARIGPSSRLVSRISWPVRQLQGKILSVLRLLKALFTFEGGLDYIAWKLERHSGQPVEIPDKVRRYPLIFIWGLFWQLYRRGIFR